MVRIFSTQNSQNSARIGVERLESRDVPTQLAGIELPPVIVTDTVAIAPALHPKQFAVASGPGQTAIVSVYSASNNGLLTTITPFDRAYTGGLNVASGDLTGDGVDDVVVATTNGGGRVKIYDGRDYSVIADFSAFSATSRGGAFVAVGDVTGDGRADLVVGAGTGNRPQIKIFRGQDLNVAAPVASANFFAYDINFTGGVRVAVGDVNGDGIGDVIAAPGKGAQPIVKIFTTQAKWGDTSFSRYGYTTTDLRVGNSGDTGGVFVRAGDMNGDGKADIAVGRTLGNRATVSVFSGANLKNRLVNAFGFTSTEPGGVPVAVRDLNGDGRAELLVGGGDGVSQVRVFNDRGGIARSFMAFPPNYRGGVYVG